MSLGVKAGGLLGQPKNHLQLCLGRPSLETQHAAAWTNEYSSSILHRNSWHLPASVSDQELKVLNKAIAMSLPFTHYGEKGKEGRKALFIIRIFH